MELEKKELDKACELDEEYIASIINPLFEKVKEINSLNKQINELKKVPKKEKAIEILDKKKIKLVQELNSINGEENNDEAIQRTFDSIPKEYNDLNIQECEREKEKKETKIKLINTKIAKLQQNITTIKESKDREFSKENINTDYRQEYNEISKERKKMIPDYNKNTLSFYNTVFNNIVPIYFYQNDIETPGTFFDFLKGRNNEQFIVCKQNDNNSYYYEIYRSGDPVINIFLLKKNFTFEKINIFIARYSFIKKEKKNIYPIINPEKSISKDIIESYLLSSKKSILIDILTFYNKFLGEPFKDWFKSFGDFTIDNTIIFFDKIDILNSFILSNEFNIYMKLYNIISKNNIIDTKIFTSKILETDEKINKIIKEKEKIKLFNTPVKIFFEVIKTFIKMNEVTDSEYYEILLSTMEKLKISSEIMNVIICIYENIIQLINDDIIYNYNFLKINNLYSLVQSKIADEKQFENNISELNKYIKYDIAKVKKIFVIELTQELLNYYLLNIPKNNFIKIFIYHIYLENLSKNNIIKNLINIEIQFRKLFYNNDLQPFLSNDQYISLSIDRIKLLNTETRYRDLRSVEHDSKTAKFFNNLLFSDELMDGYKTFNYRGKNRIFNDPRGDETADIYTTAGRPFCGEIALLNIINLLLWNSITKKIEPSYFPDTVNKPLKDFFSKNTNINNFDKPVVYLEFYELLENIPFKLKEWELEAYPNGRDNDYGDTYTKSIYRYFKKSDIDPLCIEKGIELRLSYYNLCRVLSYLLNLDEPELKLDFIQNTLSKNTLKNLISKFKNPNIEKIIQSYKFETEIDSDLFNLEEKKITLLSTKTRLGFHTEMNEIANVQDIKEFIKKTYPGTFYNHRYNDDLYIYDILQAVYVAKVKGNEIYSEIRFDKIKDEDSIKMFDILKDIENFNIPYNLIESLIDNNKTNILLYIFNNFTIFNKRKWEIFINYLIQTKDANLKKFFDRYNFIYKKKIEINRIINNLNKELFLTFKNDINTSDLKNINIDQIQDKEFFLCLIEELKYIELLDTLNSNDIIFRKYIRGLLYFKIYDTILDCIKKNQISVQSLLLENSYSFSYLLDKDNKEFFDKLKEFFRIRENFKYLIEHNIVVKTDKKLNKNNVFFSFYKMYLYESIIIQELPDNAYVMFMFLLKQTFAYQRNIVLDIGLDKELDEIIDVLLKQNYDKIAKYEKTFKLINGIIEKNNENIKILGIDLDMEKKQRCNINDHYKFNFINLQNLFKKLLISKKLNIVTIPEEKINPQLWILAKNLNIDLKLPSTYTPFELKYLKYKQKYLELKAKIK